MKTVVLIPYCPVPANTGGKADMMKHLLALLDLGPCTLASAKRKPVGTGWNPQACQELRDMGFELVFRENFQKKRTFLQCMGIVYASLALLGGMKKAFGHANPYHRYAFPEKWWFRLTAEADLAVVCYSYWARLPSACPKALVLLDLWSDYMWGGHKIETREIAGCDHVFVISTTEIDQLKTRGIPHCSWSPPLADPMKFPSTSGCALLGSANDFNQEGLRWLEEGGGKLKGKNIRVYGALAEKVRNPHLEIKGRYEVSTDPYSENEIVLLCTVQGMGVQIKTIEAFASGRVVIARKGAVRGLPLEEGAWIEVETPEDAVTWIDRLSDSKELRQTWMKKTRSYYKKYLDAENLRKELRAQYLNISQKGLGQERV